MWKASHFSDFKPLESAGKLCSNLESLRPCPLISMIGGWSSKCYNYVYCIEYEIWKIHADGEDKQQIQFAPPNGCPLAKI